MYDGYKMMELMSFLWLLTIIAVAMTIFTPPKNNNKRSGPPAWY